MSVAPTESAPIFYERIAFDKLFSGLRDQGITLTSEEEDKLKAIVRDRTRQLGGGELIGNDLGGFLYKVVHMLIYAVQNVVGNIGNGSSAGDWFTDRYQQISTASEREMLEKSTTHIMLDLTSAGGNLAKAAELVSGQFLNGHRPVDVEWSIYRQIESGIANIPTGRTNLALPVEPVPSGATLTPSPGLTTAALTQPPRRV